MDKYLRRYIRDPYGVPDYRWWPLRSRRFVWGYECVGCVKTGLMRRTGDGKKMVIESIVGYVDPHAEILVPCVIKV